MDEPGVQVIKLLKIRIQMVSCVLIVRRQKISGNSNLNSWDVNDSD